MAIALAMASTASTSAQPEPVPQSVATGTSYAVATESPYAARAAFEVLGRGGSAVDAAVAAVLDLSVTYQAECGLGGGGFLVHRSATGKVRTIDFREESPKKPYGDGVMHRTVQGSPNQTGHDVIGVPGTVAGLALAHDLGGRLPWASLFDAAIRDAREGHQVSAVMAGVLRHRREDIELFAETKKTYVKPNNETYAAGDLHVQPELAATLTRLATRTTEQAREEFYRSGKTFELLLNEFTAPSPYHEQGDDSPIEAVDLQAYKAVPRNAVVGEYRGHQVIGMGPPSSGGIAVAEILNILEGDDLETTPLANADRIHLLAEAQKIGFADRAKWMGDPDHVRIPVAELIEQRYANTRRAEIRLDVTQSYQAGSFQGYDDPAEPATTNEGPQTTHVSVVGRDGEAVAVSCSLESGLGSAVVAAGTGILLNAHLYDFDEGAPEGAANAYKPEKRPRSSMSPTIVVKDGEVVLVAGAQGGPDIIMTVLQTVQGVVNARLAADQAIARPRVYLHNDETLLPPALMIEQFPWTPDGAVLYADLRRRGHRDVHVPPEYDAAPATVSAVTVEPDGLLTAANDQRPWERPFTAAAAPGSLAR